LRTKFALLTFALFSLFICSANAQWSALNSGYAVTTDYHGEDVIPGTLVTATAGTTDPNVRNVTFVWMFPNKSIAIIDAEVVVGSNGIKYPDDDTDSLIYYAQSSFRPTVVGNWGVQAWFNGPGGHLHGPETDIIAIRATSINVIPEIPVAGSLGAVTAMLLGLGLYWIKKKQQF
jgi:hypothetical protein